MFTPDKTSSKEAEESGCKWFPYNKGGSYCKWYGNNLPVVNWRNDGAEIKEWVVTNPNDPNTTSWSRRVFNHEHFFCECVTWTLLSGTNFCVRYIPHGAVFNVNGPSLFGLGKNVRYIAALMNSTTGLYLLRAINPTLAFNPGDVAKLPVLITDDKEAFQAVDSMAQQIIDAHRAEWDTHEESWGFTGLPLVELQQGRKMCAESWNALQDHSACAKRMCQELEGQLNRFFSELYGLSDEVSSDVNDVDPSLMTPDRSESVRRLVSYAIGCMMGRYTLDKPGLIYAHSGNLGFHTSQYMTFPADRGGIIPLPDFEWFEDDTAKRFKEFIATAWPKEHLEENLKFVAEGLGPKSSESSRATIRRYLATGFYKHHLSMYKRRPIYWMFSSGKQRAFQALVYLHRYNEGTLSRMRTEYVVPLLGKISARIGHLDQDITGATGKHRRDLEKEQATLRKQLAELQEYDDKLRSYTDQRIALDLDDGVKVNYAKFGDLLAEVKAVTGGSDDE